MILRVNYNGTLKQIDIPSRNDISNIIADEYSASSTYAVGDIVLHNGTLYECTTAIQSGEEWTAGHWNAITIVNKLDDKYEKPSGGIPASDLSNAVQTSLGKADTALQTAPTPDWNAVSGADGYIDNKPNIRQGTDTNHTAVVEGNYTTASGVYSHAEGSGTQATGDYSHAEGGSARAIAYCAHAEGAGTLASGETAHAEGGGTTASGSGAHAEGGTTTASGNQSHSEGGGTTASGNYSHAEGSYTVASALNSHVEGTYTEARSSFQHVQGKYNIIDSADTYAHIVGNGTNNARSNAHTLDWNGNGWYAGKLTVGTAPTNNMDVATKQYVDDEVGAKYEKPSGGIPDTDLSSAVQASLGKADTALQSAPVTSVNTKTGAVTLDADDIGYDGTETYTTGTVGDTISTLSSDLSNKLDTPSTAGTSGQILTSDGHGGQIWEDALSGVDAIGDGTVTIVEAGSDIIKTASTSTADFDISDSSGNVLVRFEDGHIKTKEFDSSDVYPLRGKKWACVGDSLTEANVRTTLHYHDYIAELTGLNVVNMGHSGAGFYARSFDYAFMNEVQNVPTDSDIVTIFGGGNDIGQISLGNVTDITSSTLCGCVNITLDNLFTRLPIAYVGVVTPTPWYQTTESIDWTPSNHGNDLEEYCEAIVEICRRRSIPCLDLYHMSNLRPQEALFRQLAYSKDSGNGVHPDETGHKLIAARFMEFIRSIILC